MFWCAQLKWYEFSSIENKTSPSFSFGIGFLSWHLPIGVVSFDRECLDGLSIEFRKRYSQLWCVHFSSIDISKGKHHHTLSVGFLQQTNCFYRLLMKWICKRNGQLFYRFHSEEEERVGYKPIDLIPLIIRFQSVWKMIFVTIFIDSFVFESFNVCCH